MSKWVIIKYFLFLQIFILIQSIKIQFEKIVCKYLAYVLRFNKELTEAYKEKAEIITVYQKESEIEVDNEKEKPVDEIPKEILKYQTKLCNDVNFIKKTIEKEDNFKKNLAKWRFAAKVIDRLGFFLSILYLIITVVAIMLSVEGFYHFK